MIAPTFHGGHEVTAPVQIEGAEVVTASLFSSRRNGIRSKASASGVMTTNAKAFNDDPFDQLELRRLLDRNISRLRPTQNLINTIGGPPE